MRENESTKSFLGWQVVYCISLPSVTVSRIDVYQFLAGSSSNRTKHDSIFDISLLTTPKNELHKFPFAATICSFMLFPSMASAHPSSHLVEWHRKCTKTREKKRFSDDNRKVIGAIAITLKTWTLFYAIVIVVKCLSIIDECACVCARVVFIPHSVIQSVGRFVPWDKCKCIHIITWSTIFCQVTKVMLKL